MSNLNGQSQHLRHVVSDTIEQYFDELGGEEVTDVYKMVLNEVEKPLLEQVMAYTKQNQSKACMILGINRGTLRKKLKQYELI